MSLLVICYRCLSTATPPLCTGTGFLSSTQLPISTQVLGVLLSQIATLLPNSMELAELQHVFPSFITLPANFPSQFPPGSFMPQKNTKKNLVYPTTYPMLNTALWPSCKPGL